MFEEQVQEIFFFGDCNVTDILWCS